LSFAVTAKTPFIRAILFDLGGTLMYADGPWPPILALADRALSDALRSEGMELDSSLFRARLEQYYSRRDRELYETTYHFILREALVESGYADPPEDLLRKALDALFSVTQMNWRLEQDAILTLGELQSDGYRLGLVSNAGDNQDVLQLAASFGIDTYFDFILTSAACSYRKPHARIFEIALAHWLISPQEAAMVGDALEADILGAKSLGLYTIWLTRRAQYDSDEALRIVPEVRLTRLREIPGHLRTLRQGIGDH